jgi:hypothetical protein
VGFEYTLTCHHFKVANKERFIKFISISVSMSKESDLKQILNQSALMVAAASVGKYGSFLGGISSVIGDEPDVGMAFFAGTVYVTSCLAEYYAKGISTAATVEPLSETLDKIAENLGIYKN